MKKIVLSGLLAAFCLNAEYSDALIRKLDQNHSSESFRTELRQAMKKKQINKHNCAAVFIIVGIVSLCEWSNDLLDELEEYLIKHNLIRYLK